MIEKKIHFICTGNVYRSRLAEAYFNSLKIPNLKAFSSGIEADHSTDGPIEWYAMKLLRNTKLVPFMSFDCQKTSRDLLKVGDFTVFMEQKHLDFCKEKLEFVPEFYKILDIQDIHTAGLTDAQIIEITQKTFVKIISQVDAFVKKLKS